jgi:hypothetical protein
MATTMTMTNSSLRELTLTSNDQLLEHEVAYITSCILHTAITSRDQKLCYNLPESLLPFYAEYFGVVHERIVKQFPEVSIRLTMLSDDIHNTISHSLLKIMSEMTYNRLKKNIYYIHVDWSKFLFTQ